MKKQLLCFLMFFTAVSGFSSEGGFLFVHSSSENSQMGEQVYFGLSPDARTWETLNKEAPVLVSNIGKKGARDPFLLRSPDGQKFFLLATDLSIHAINRNFARAATGGSRAIVVWESSDLVNWSEPRLVDVAAEDAGCAWAPEAVYDEQTHSYLVFWSSKNRSDNFAKHRIWATRTHDFKAFEKPFIFFDPPEGVSEITIVREFGAYYRFSSLGNGTLTMETSNNLSADWQPVAGFSLKGMRAAGAAPVILKQSVAGPLPTWALFVDTSGRGYQAYITEDLGGGVFAPFEMRNRFRTGSILSLTPEEYTRLKKAFP